MQIPETILVPRYLAEYWARRLYERRPKDFN
jgi:hypothetical protein